MFDAELRKPSSLALGAFTADDVLVGYAFVSRYVDAWHVMNVAVADEFRRRGIASALLGRLFEVTEPTRAAATRSRCACRTRARSGCTSSSASSRAGTRRGYYTDNREDALIMWREPASSERAS